jgi:hypothetical protein
MFFGEGNGWVIKEWEKCQDFRTHSRRGKKLINFNGEIWFQESILEIAVFYFKKLISII